MRIKENNFLMPIKKTSRRNDSPTKFSHVTPTNDMLPKFSNLESPKKASVPYRFPQKKVADKRFSETFILFSNVDNDKEFENHEPEILDFPSSTNKMLLSKTPHPKFNQKALKPRYQSVERGQSNIEV
jgi:hypothetical protein